MHFFFNRVVKYWNLLPVHVKDSPSVNTFKNRIDKFRTIHFDTVTTGQYWEMSYMIYQRL